MPFVVPIDDLYLLFNYPTMEAALKAITAERGDRGEIQIELYGDWTFEQAQLWLDAGISSYLSPIS